MLRMRSASLKTFIYLIVVLTKLHCSIPWKNESGEYATCEQYKFLNNQSLPDQCVAIDFNPNLEQNCSMVRQLILILCPVQFIWTEHWMLKLVLNVKYLLLLSFFDFGQFEAHSRVP